MPEYDINQITVTSNGSSVTANLHDSQIPDVNAALEAILDGGGSEPVLVAKTITQNGTYTASSDNADGYSSVVADVPNTYSSSDNGKVVQNGALVTQTSTTKTENGTYDTTTNNSVTVNVPDRWMEAITLSITYNTDVGNYAGTISSNGSNRANSATISPLALMCGNMIHIRGSFTNGGSSNKSSGYDLLTITNDNIKKYSEKTLNVNATATIYNTNGNLSASYRMYKVYDTSSINVNYVTGTVTIKAVCDISKYNSSTGYDVYQLDCTMYWT